MKNQQSWQTENKEGEPVSLVKRIFESEEIRGTWGPMALHFGAREEKEKADSEEKHKNSSDDLVDCLFAIFNVEIKIDEIEQEIGR